MKCEHGEEILIVQKMRSPRMSDGMDVLIEGCEICAQDIKSEIR